MAEPILVTRAHIDALHKLLRYFDSQSDIAETLGVSRQAVSHWFSAEKVIPLTQARRLALILGDKVTLEELRPDFAKILKKDLKQMKKNVY